MGLLKLQCVIRDSYKAAAHYSQNTLMFCYIIYINRSTYNHNTHITIFLMTPFPSFSWPERIRVSSVSKTLLWRYDEVSTF